MNSEASEAGTMTARQRLLPVFTLSAFAIAQPLLSALTQRSIFLHDLRPRWPELIALCVVLLLCIPGIIWGLDCLMATVTRRRAMRARDAVIFGLFVLLSLSFTRALIDSKYLQDMGISWLVSTGIAVAAGAALTWIWQKQAVARQLLHVAGLGLLVFPAHFLWTMSFVLDRQTPTPMTQTVPAKHPVPVVMVVFDELCGLSLMNEERQIDSVRFPNFARLARLSTWYRNASANHGETERALPAILSGRMPDPTAAHPPSVNDQNLFRLIQQTGQYEFAIFEPYSRMCSDELRPVRTPLASTWTGQLRILCETLFYAYPHLIFARDMPVTWHPIPEAWFGLSRPAGQSAEHRRGLLRYHWNSARSEQFQHFINCIDRSEKPGFYFIHVALPHFPWQFFPSGNHYLPDNAQSQQALGTTDEMWADNASVCRNAEVRYLFQLGYVDQLIGTLLDRLDSTGLMSDCQLIVTADHGVSFVPGHSRRKPDSRTLPDIVSIPLFVKSPDQKVSSISDRNVESIDILPTIVDACGLPIVTPLDGESLADSGALSRPRKTFCYGKEIAVLDADFPDARRRLNELCRDNLPGTDWSQLFPRGPAADLAGQPLSSLKIIDSDITTTLLKPLARTTLRGSRFIHAMIEGQLLSDIPEGLCIVIAANGRILTSTEPIRSGDDTGWWSVILPESVAGTINSNSLEFYTRWSGSPRQLERLKIQSIGARSVRY